MKRLLSLVLIFAACGDNKDVPDARTRPDGLPDDARAVVPTAMAVAGDFMSPGTGIMSKLEVDTLTVRQNLGTVVQGDPALRYIDGKLYVINRFGSNNVVVLDAETLMFEEQISTGADSNPQDVAVVGNKLYVPALGTAGVVVLTRGSTATTTIDLSELDTMGADDGLPECVSAYAIGNRVYVACSMLDSFNPVQPGKIAVIDATTDTMVSSVEMNYRRPVGFLVPTPAASTYTGDLLITSLPDFTNYATGCIERVTTGTTTTVACGVTNQELGGFANKLAVSADDKQLYIAVTAYDSSFNETGKLRSFDLMTGTLAAEPLSTSAQLITDVATCPKGDVIAIDNTVNAGGLRAWRGTTERTTSALSIGLPPKSVNSLVCFDGGR